MTLLIQLQYQVEVAEQLSIEQVQQKVGQQRNQQEQPLEPRPFM